MKKLKIYMNKVLNLIHNKYELFKIINIYYKNDNSILSSKIYNYNKNLQRRDVAISSNISIFMCKFKGGIQNEDLERGAIKSIKRLSKGGC